MYLCIFVHERPFQDFLFCGFQFILMAIEVFTFPKFHDLEEPAAIQTHRLYEVVVFILG